MKEYTNGNMEIIIKGKSGVGKGLLLKEIKQLFENSKNYKVIKTDYNYFKLTMVTLFKGD